MYRNPEMYASPQRKLAAENAKRQRCEEQRAADEELRRQLDILKSVAHYAGKRVARQPSPTAAKASDGVDADSALLDDSLRQMREADERLLGRDVSAEVQHRRPDSFCGARYMVRRHRAAEVPESSPHHHHHDGVQPQPQEHHDGDDAAQQQLTAEALAAPVVQPDAQEEVLESQEF